MKHFISILLFLATIHSSSQSINTEMDSDTENPYLLGKINRHGLTSEPYNIWFNENYDHYDVDEITLKTIAPLLRDYGITIFLGTWCGDSKREVPRFYKILEASNFPMEQLSVIAVNNSAEMYKQSPQHEEEGLNIHRVPTFIFYKNGKETNRIVEHPIESLEKDIENIITKNTYTSAYNVVNMADEMLQKGQLKNSKKILKKLKTEAKSLYELNTYAHILFTTDRQEQAMEVLKLNIGLFPKESRAYENIAHKYYVLNDPKTARHYYQKALELDPENLQLQSYINALSQ